MAMGRGRHCVVSRANREGYQKKRTQIEEHPPGHWLIALVVMRLQRHVHYVLYIVMRTLLVLRLQLLSSVPYSYSISSSATVR